jgi:hypothetical protein
MSRRCNRFALLAATLLLPTFARADTIEIKPGDHISIVGNTLADRMQHDGWLETDLQARFPEHKLVIRNLGFSGDELTLRPQASPVFADRDRGASPPRLAGPIGDQRTSEALLGRDGRGGQS